MSYLTSDDPLPADYERCAVCGFDHQFDVKEATEAHMRHDKQEFDNVTKHIEILVTGCGYVATTADDPGYQGLSDGEVLMWHPKTGHAYVIKVERLPQEDLKEDEV